MRCQEKISGSKFQRDADSEDGVGRPENRYKRSLQRAEAEPTRDGGDGEVDFLESWGMSRLGC